MLKNYITDSDLQKYYPKISSYLWSGSSSYATQITEAFNIIIDDLISREIDYVNIGMPLDLLRSLTSSSNQHKLTYETFSANDFKTHINGYQKGFRRLVIDVLAESVSNNKVKLVLQGSNDIGIADSTEPSNWIDISTTDITTTGVVSSVFQNEFNYYRIGVYHTDLAYTTTDNVTSFTEGTAFASGTVRISCSLFETYIDRWIIWKVFELIFRDFSKENQDIWDKRADDCARYYKQSLDGFKFTNDINKDNLITRADTLNQDAQSRLYR